MTKAELVERALRILNVVPYGQTAEADDAAVVDALVVPLLARLSGEHITTILDPDAIPEDQFLDVAILLADVAKSEFGLAALPQDDPDEARVRLRTIVSVGPTMETVEDEDQDGNPITYEQPATLRPEYF